MNPSKWTALVCALVALGLMIGGCGGSDNGDGATPSEASAGQTGGGNAGSDGNADGQSDASSGSSPATRAERPIAKNKFAAEATEICATSNKEILLQAQYYVRKNKDEGKSSAALQAEAVDLIFIPNLKEQVEAIGELELPEGEEAQAEAFIAAMEEGIETTEDNTYTAANIEELGREFHKAGKLAQSFFRISGCGFGA